MIDGDSEEKSMLDLINDKLATKEITNKPNLVNVFEHIYYEFGTFYGLAHAIAFKNRKHFGDFSNAILESYRIHLRCVADFFLVNRRRDGDICFNDILKDTAYENVVFDELSKKARDGINKSTGHLTKERMTKSVEIQSDIFNNDDFKKQANNIGVFLRLLSANNIKDEYAEQLNVPELIEKLNILKSLYEVEN